MPHPQLVIPNSFIWAWSSDHTGLKQIVPACYVILGRVAFAAVSFVPVWWRRDRLNRCSLYFSWGPMDVSAQSLEVPQTTQVFNCIYLLVRLFQRWRFLQGVFKLLGLRSVWPNPASRPGVSRARAGILDLSAFLKCFVVNTNWSHCSALLAGRSQTRCPRSMVPRSDCLNKSPFKQGHSASEVSVRKAPTISDTGTFLREGKG